MPIVPYQAAIWRWRLPAERRHLVAHADIDILSWAVADLFDAIIEVCVSSSGTILPSTRRVMISRAPVLHLRVLPWILFYRQSASLAWMPCIDISSVPHFGSVFFPR